MSSSPVGDRTPRLVLASGSPRRRELLGHLGLSFEVMIPDVDETPLPGEDAAAMVGRLAVAKARAVDVDRCVVVIAADTTVALGGVALGKPADADDAVATLLRLAGKTHDVHTGVAVRRGDDLIHEIVSAHVTLGRMDERVARWYVSTGEPMDKAGAYAIQGIGGMFVDRVEGNVQAIIGLPMATVCALTDRVGCRLR